MIQVWITIDLEHTQGTTVYIDDKKADKMISKIEIRNDLLVIVTHQHLEILYLDKLVRNKDNKLDVYLHTKYGVNNAI